jgi:hypothetical protein
VQNIHFREEINFSEHFTHLSPCSQVLSTQLCPSLQQRQHAPASFSISREGSTPTVPKGSSEACRRACRASEPFGCYATRQPSCCFDLRKVIVRFFHIGLSTV